MDVATYKKNVAFLNVCSAKYYLEDRSLISDQAFDILYQQILMFEQLHPELCDPNSPTQRIGPLLTEKAPTKKHRHVMASLDNTFDEKSSMSWVKKWQDAIDSESPMEIIVEPKIDGLAINLIYENGILCHALTRGDGEVGEDVTSNIKTLPSIPLTLIDTTQPYLEIRGEVFMSLGAFKKLNAQLQSQKKEGFANPRNAAAGSVRQLSPALASKRQLSFFPYAVLGHSSLHSQSESLTWLKQQGFSLSELISEPLVSFEQVAYHYHKIVQSRPNLSYEIDGSVLKVNDFLYQKKFGYTHRAPKWAFAWKFDSTCEETVLLDVDFQVGRLGSITPVAVLKPVHIAGVLVSSATLHNEDEINKKDLHLQDFVLVRRAGDVIPEVVEPILARRSGQKVKKIRFPSHCPSCGTSLIRDKSAYQCPNLHHCPEQHILQLLHFCSKKALNIEFLSIQTIKQLVSKKIVRSREDFFKLKKEDLMRLEGFAEKSSTNLLESINRSRLVVANKVLYALGCPHVGQVAAKKICGYYRLETLGGVTCQQLEALDGVGPKIARSLKEFLKHDTIRCTLDYLVENLFIQNSLDNSTVKDNCENYVLTGQFKGYTREELVALITASKGNVQSQITKKTHYLVAGNKAGSKLAKAQKLGIKVITLDELLKHLKY